MPGENFWPQAEKFTYYVLLPSLFFKSVATANFTAFELSSTIIVLIATVCIMAAITYISKYALRIDGPTFTSLFQGSIRFNNYVGIPIAIALFNDDGLILSAIMIAVLVPIINSLCVAVLNFHGNLEKTNLTKNIVRIITNPLILACILGFIINFTNLALPNAINNVIDSLSKGALVFGLLTVGAGLDLEATKGQRHIMLITSGIKLILYPAIALLLCIQFNITGTTGQMIILYSALPCASSSYVMARQLGGNAPIMAGITVMEVILAAITMPVVLVLAQTFLSP